LGELTGRRFPGVGVEPESHLAWLRGWSCDVMQGYVFSKPLPPIELAELLRERRRLPGAGMRQFECTNPV
jgi:EAL domain-containing protein (putative c-di-GMP-specific phosphodiesterase class I)